MPLPPTGNRAATEDNVAHEAVRRLDPLVEQLRRFLRPDGQVEQTCGGPCDFPR